VTDKRLTFIGYPKF